MIENKIMDIMDKIEYGFMDGDGLNIIENNLEKWDNDFFDFYYLLAPEELLEKKCGVCFDQVELERKLFEENHILVASYFICTYDGDNFLSHTFLTYEKDNSFYWFEHSWGIYRGIHKYDSINSLLLDVRDKFINSHNADVNSYTFIYYYEKPKFHISCKEFYDYCERGKLIKLNSPLYFYHVVNKNADLSRGLLSLEYMYQHKLFDLFDRSVNKYKRRIVKDWNIAKYKNRDEESLSREEILDALKIFRGDFGTSYIYFFKYPPYKELGKKMEELLKVKDIYRININDEAVQKNIKNIFYGYENSSSDSKILNKSYYENISKEEYFSNYDDKLSMNFARLNHISIAFKDEFCPIEFLEKL